MVKIVIGIILLLLLLLVGYFCILKKKCNNVFPFSYFTDVEEEYKN